MCENCKHNTVLTAPAKSEDLVRFETVLNGALNRIYDMQSMLNKDEPNVEYVKSALDHLHGYLKGAADLFNAFPRYPHAENNGAARGLSAGTAIGRG